MSSKRKDLNSSSYAPRRAQTFKMHCVIFLLFFFTCPEIANSSLIANLSTKSIVPEKESAIKFSIILRNQTEDMQLNQPRLAPIPSKGDVNPHKADEVPPSAELKAIISRVKKESLTRSKKTKKHTQKDETSDTALEIIRQKGQGVMADEVSASPALKAVLAAYRNGSLTYTHRSFDLEDEQEQVYYHQPYADLKLQSIFDLTVLTSGKDIFLSLGYAPLEHQHKTEKESKSRRIKDLQQIIIAFNLKDKRKAAALSPDEKELERIRAAAKAKIQPRKLMVKNVLDFFGIRRRGGEHENYEEMTNAFRIYKQWVNRWERMDMYVKRKKKQRIQLNRFTGKTPGRTIYSSPRYNDRPLSKQIQINPYAHEKIYQAP